MRKVFIVLCMLLVLITGLFATGQSEDGSGEISPDTIKNRGKLKIGVSVFTPWVMPNKAQELIGFEVDVARKLAEDMGVELELIETEWAGIIPALRTGQFDVIIGGMSITEERMKSVDFTEPYEYNGMSMAISRALVPNEPTALEELNSSDITVSIRTGTISEDIARQQIPNANIKSFTKEEEMVLDVVNGNSHLFISAAPLPSFEAEDRPNELYVPNFGKLLTKDPIGMALKKGNSELLDYLNGWIAENWANNFLAERYSYWFETKDWENQIQ